MGRVLWLALVLFSTLRLSPAHAGAIQFYSSAPRNMSGIDACTCGSNAAANAGSRRTKLTAAVEETYGAVISGRPWTVN